MDVAQIKQHDSWLGSLLLNIRIEKPLSFVNK